MTNCTFCLILRMKVYVSWINIAKKYFGFLKNMNVL